MTRARDYLVFVPSAKSAAWLKVLDAPGGPSYVTPPAADDNLIGVGDDTFVADVRGLTADDDTAPRHPQPAYVTTRAAPAPVPPLFVKPSQATGDGWRVVERFILGSRLRVDGVTDMAALGEGLHAVLAYDDPARDADRLWRTPPTSSGAGTCRG